MAILVEQNTYENNPMPEGFHAAVFTSVKDLGMRPSAFGEKRMIIAKLVNAEGQEATRFYSPSLHEKATLAKDLLALTGSIPKKFDIDALVGQQCRVFVTEKIKADGTVDAKIEKLAKPTAGQKVVPPVKGAKPAAKAAAPKKVAAPVAEPAVDDINDDDVAF